MLPINLELELDLYLDIDKVKNRSFYWSTLLYSSSNALLGS
jgi:hypothetical protein